jgi:hypothetical protein
MSGFNQPWPYDGWEDENELDHPARIIRWPPHAPQTGELPYDHDQQCPYCQEYYCDFCGFCHTPGCTGASVVCSDAQTALMYRDPEDIPDDGPVYLSGYSENPDSETVIGFIGIVLALLVVGWIVLHVFLHAF